MNKRNLITDLENAAGYAHFYQTAAGLESGTDQEIEEAIAFKIRAKNALLDAIEDYAFARGAYNRALYAPDPDPAALQVAEKYLESARKAIFG